jgi:oligoendopeptidase F
MNSLNSKKMSAFLATTPQDFIQWSWTQIEPYYVELQKQILNASTLAGWMANWSQLSGMVYEAYQRLYVAITIDTTDQYSQSRYDTFLDEIFVRSEEAEQKLKEKLLKSGLEPPDFELSLRNLRAEAAIFTKENLSWLSKEIKLKAEYDRIIGSQSIVLEEQEFTLSQLHALYLSPDRQKREYAWRLGAQRQLADRQAINELWIELMEVRGRLAKNAGLSDYRTYRWTQLLRFDYTPGLCYHFHQAIKDVVVPAARYLHEKRRQKLGIRSLCPWDLFINLDGPEPLHPFDQVGELEEGVARIFKQLDPELGRYFEIMRMEGLLDLENRKGKAPGGYCTDYPVTGRPFIFMNAVGVHEDVQTLIHEGGHAFHVFETNHLPYIQQKRMGIEFMEVASTAMELLSTPYLVKNRGGFYTPAEAARAQIEFLDTAICFWPYMAVVDAFQHWVYENHQAASNPVNCDARWAQLWEQYMADEDWDGLDEERITGWQRKLHIIQDPFYYIEYGLAQLGAFQIWCNALNNQQAAVAAYRRALSIGGTVSLPQLYALAGAKFAFDARTLQEAVDLGINAILALEGETERIHK